MKILSHRGYWQTPTEKNTTTAFCRSFDLGYGTETDVRDLAGELVISHDLPIGNPLTLAEFLALIDDQSMPLAINIKSDGLAEVLAQHFSKRKLDWFVFDMSVPDTLSHFKAGNPVFARMSEVEKTPAWLDEAQGVWLDAFFEEWYGTDLVESLLNRGKRVCIVSSELHGRDPAPLWSRLTRFSAHTDLMLCTDRPEDAQHRFFGALSK